VRYAGVIERPFASNISENAAVKLHSQLALASPGGQAR